MTADPRALSELLEESQDLQADALRPTHEALDELVEFSHSSGHEVPASNLAFHEEHQRRCARASPAHLLGAAGGAALVGLSSPPPRRPAVRATCRFFRRRRRSRTSPWPPTRRH